jgi:hypothetical protein
LHRQIRVKASVLKIWAECYNRDELTVAVVEAVETAASVTGGRSGSGLNQLASMVWYIIDTLLLENIIYLFIKNISI